MRTPLSLLRSTILPTPPTTAGSHELLQPAATARRRSSPSGSPLFPSWIDSFNHWSVGGFIPNNWMECLSSHLFFFYWFVAIFFFLVIWRVPSQGRIPAAWLPSGGVSAGRLPGTGLPSARGLPSSLPAAATAQEKRSLLRRRMVCTTTVPHLNTTNLLILCMQLFQPKSVRLNCSCKKKRLLFLKKKWNVRDFELQFGRPLLLLLVRCMLLKSCYGRNRPFQFVGVRYPVSILVLCMWLDRCWCLWELFAWLVVVVKICFVWLLW